jgi:hypothetical protein
MSRLAIAFVVAFTMTSANAQNTGSEQSRTSTVAGVNDTQPFLFDGRMRGDGNRGRARTDDHRPNTGTVIMPPKATQPARE